MQSTLGRAQQRLKVLLLWGLSTVMPHALSGELADLIGLAEAHDANYAATLAAVKAVRAEVGLVRADLLPRLNFRSRIGGNSQDIDVAPGAFGLSGEQNFDSENYELVARQPLLQVDKWLKLRQVDRRVAQVEAEAAAEHAALVFQVIERYFDAVGGGAVLRASLAEERALKTRLAEYRVRLANQDLTTADLQLTLAEFSRARAETVRVRNDIGLAHDALAELVGTEVDITQALKLRREVVALEPSTLPPWLAMVEQFNARVLAARTMIEVAQYDQKIAGAGRWPTLALAGRYGKDVQGGRFGETEIVDKSIRVELDVPIFQGGAVRAREQMAAHRLSEISARADAETRAAQRAAKEAYRRVTNSIVAVEAASATLTASEAAHKVLEVQHTNGERTTSEVLDAEHQVFDAQRQLMRALQDYIVGSLQLKYVSGTLSMSDIAAAETWLQPKAADTEQVSLFNDAR